MSEFKYPEDFKDYDFVDLSDVCDEILEKEGSQGYETLSELEKTVVNIYLFDMEVRNGGIDQYFSNSSGDHVDDAVLALNRIGATDVRNLLETACKEFPAGKVPSDRGRRVDILLDEISETERGKWSDLDERYYEYDEPTLLELLWKYLKDKDAL